MRIQISACTDKVFSEGLLPMAYLTGGSVLAVNDNAARSQAKENFACIGSAWSALDIMPLGKYAVRHSTSICR